MKSDYLVLSCSLNPKSRSRAMATVLVERLRERGVTVELADLREWSMPLCDGDSAYADAKVTELSARIEAAGCIVFSVPIYNYDVSATAKNLVELTGSVFENKIVGFMCAAGGRSSYMSVMSFANSLMLDFRSFILPRFVYATGDAFGPSGLEDADVRQRVDDLAAEAIRVTSALRPQAK